MIKIVGLIVVLLIVALLIFATTKPDVFRVQRSIGVQAPTAVIFPLLNDFHQWLAWSPYEKLDPDMKRVYSGEPAGKGSVYGWSGNSKAGEGRIEVTDSLPPSKVSLSLEFVRPFAARNRVNFTLEPSGDKTFVTWAMDGPLPYAAKVMHIFFNMDAMVGKDFDAGLANLKSTAERSHSSAILR